MIAHLQKKNDDSGNESPGEHNPANPANAAAVISSTADLPTILAAMEKRITTTLLQKMTDSANMEDNRSRLAMSQILAEDSESSSGSEVDPPIHHKAHQRSKGKQHSKGKQNMRAQRMLIIC